MNNFEPVNDTKSFQIEDSGESNVISLEWYRLESKDASKINHVCVKYVIGLHGEIVAGREVVMELSAQHATTEW